MKRTPTGWQFEAAALRYALAAFAILIMALVAHSDRRWDETMRQALIVQDRLHQSRRLMTSAALVAERNVQGDPRSRIDVVRASLDRALANVQDLHSGSGSLAGFAAAGLLPAHLRDAVDAHGREMEDAAKLMFQRFDHPGMVSMMDVRRALHSVSVSASRTESLLLEDISRRRMQQRRLDAATIAMIGALSVVLFVLLESVRRRRIAAVEELRDSEARLAAFVGGLPGLALLLDREGRYLAIHGKETQDLSAPKELLIGRRIGDILPAEVGSGIQAAIETAIREERAVTHAYELARPEGQAVFEARIVPVGDSGRVICLVNDVTQRREEQARIRLLAAGMESSREGVLITGLDGRIVFVNRAYTELTGFTEAQSVGRLVRLRPSEIQDARFNEAMRADVRREGHWQGELWQPTLDGRMLPLFVSVDGVQDPSGQRSHYVATMTDLRSLKAAEDRIQQMLHLDPLTRRPNLRAMRAEIEDSVGAARRRGGMAAVALLDLNEFQRVNDALGRELGDALLSRVADRIEEALGTGGTVGREAGDEFIILLRSSPDADAVGRKASAILDAIQPPFLLDDEHEVFLTARIGVALYPDDGATANTLLRCAETALHQAKRSMGSELGFYASELTSAAGRRIALERRLRRALNAEQFELHFQPLIELSTGRLVGSEALVRMKPDGEPPVGPGEFIPLMEDSGMILELGRWVQRQACLQLRQWLDAGLEPGFVAVNLSASEVHSGRIAEQLRAIVQETGVPRDRLELEMTESSLMSRGGEAEAFLQGLRADGFRLAIDDFGTGYSSLAYLKRFPVQKLKIDRSFIRDIPDDRDDMQLTQSIISLAHNLGLRVVAEGVETEAQRAFLESLRCDVVQGYLFSPPLPAAAFASRFLTQADRRQDSASPAGH